MTAPADDPLGDFFASGSVSEHVVRGVLGLVLVVASLALAATTPWALLGLLAAGVAWRGCPTCWSLGLMRTLAKRAPACSDGSCAAGPAAAPKTAMPPA